MLPFWFGNSKRKLSGSLQGLIQICIDNKKLHTLHHMEKTEKTRWLLFPLKVKVSEFFHDEFGLNYLK